VTWWLETINLWDHMPAEFTIVHPNLVWAELYWRLYVREMELWGSSPPLRAVSGEDNSKVKPPGSWYRARKEAMRILSIEHTGLDLANEGPLHHLKLQKRGDHSNYAECNTCAELRAAVEAAMNRSATLEDRRQLRAEQIKHVDEVHAERRVVAEFRSIATRCMQPRRTPH
jgi:hypothetical protein